MASLLLDKTMTSKTNKPETPTNKRLQLNLRLDGREDLVEAIKATAETKGLSVNSWVVGLLESATGMEPANTAPTGGDLEVAVTSVLDKLLADKLVKIKSELKAELLGESAAAREGNDESLRLELQADVGWVEQELNEVRGNCRVLEAERDKACADREQVEAQLSELKEELAKEKDSYSTLVIISQQLNQQLETERADREQLQAQLSDLQKRLGEAEENGTPLPDLRGKVGDIASYVKSLIAEDRELVKNRKLTNRKQDKEVKLPKEAMSKLETILGGGDG